MLKKAEQFYYDLQDLLKLTSKKDVLFIIGDWNTKVGSQEIPWVIGKFSLLLLDYTKAFDYMDHNKLWKILKEMGIRDQLTCLPRSLCADQEATVRTGHGTMNWFLIGKGVCQGCILSPCYLAYMQSTSCEMLCWMKHKLDSRLEGEISITSDTQMVLPLWQKVKGNERASWWR